MTEAMQILVGLLAEVRSNLKQVDQSSEPELRDLLGSALRGLEKALHRKPTVVVSGEPNSGKTSVANLLAGLEVLPAAVVANTAVPVLLRHGVSPSVFAVTPEGRLPLSVAMGDAYQPYLYADLERIEVGLPSMRDHGFEILDTPSWAERDRLIEDADVLIWCSVAARPWTESERQALADLPQRLRARSLLVITHKDTLALSDRGRVFARYKEMAGPFFSEIMMVDATARRSDADQSNAPRAALDDAERLQEHLQSVLAGFWNHRAQTGRRICRHISRTLAAALANGPAQSTPAADASPSPRTYAKIAEQLASV